MFTFAMARELKMSRRRFLMEHDSRDISELAAYLRAEEEERQAQKQKKLADKIKNAFKGLGKGSKG